MDVEHTSVEKRLAMLGQEALRALHRVGAHVVHSGKNNHAPLRGVHQRNIRGVCEHFEAGSVQALQDAFEVSARGFFWLNMLVSIEEACVEIAGNGFPHVAKLAEKDGTHLATAKNFGKVGDKAFIMVPALLALDHVVVDANVVE